MDKIESTDSGTFTIVTASGTMLILDKDGARAVRYPGVVKASPGFYSALFSTDERTWHNIQVEWPVQLGETVRLTCDPPMNWYRSTPVVEIERVE